MSMSVSFRTYASIAGGILLAGLLVIPSFFVFSQVKDAARNRRHAYEVIVQAKTLLASLSDAEASQRDFMLAGDEAFLGAYLAVREGVHEQLGLLLDQNRTGAARAHLEALKPLVDMKLAELSQGIELRRGHQMKRRRRSWPRARADS
jgi:CHASE3 domain sensor protein